MRQGTLQADEAPLHCELRSTAVPSGVLSISLMVKLLTGAALLSMSTRASLMPMVLPDVMPPKLYIGYLKGLTAALALTVVKS